MKLFLGGQFSLYIPGHPPSVEVNLAEPTHLNKVLAGLGIPVADIHLAVVNGQLVEMDEAVVSDQDDVKIFPPVGGGTSLKAPNVFETSRASERGGFKNPATT
jgi:sulfur carrier protein ThiS